MNYLAHILLSGPNPSCKVGGFIADFVKGSKLQNYPLAMQQGIMLHRNIDTFTDNHVWVTEARGLIRPYYGLYAGVFLDIYFDHFLATNWLNYSSEPLLHFTRNFCFDLIGHYPHLPSKVKHFAWHFILTNRLYQYSKIKGIERVFEIMETTRNLPYGSRESISILHRHYMELEICFNNFFPELCTYAKECAASARTEPYPTSKE